MRLYQYSLLINGEFMLTFFLAASFFSAPGCTGNVNPPDPDTIADVQETVFRYLFKKNGSAVQQKAKTYFLSIKNIDPGANFLKRFEEHQPPVKAGSEFKQGKGILFTIDSLKWIDNNTAEVEGGYYEHGKSASGNRYRIVRERGQWRVAIEERLWVS